MKTTSIIAVVATLFAASASAITISLPSGVTIPSGITLPTGVTVVTPTPSVTATVVAGEDDKDKRQITRAFGKRQGGFGQFTQSQSATSAAAKAQASGKAKKL